MDAREAEELRQRVLLLEKRLSRVASPWRPAMIGLAAGLFATLAFSSLPAVSQLVTFNAGAPALASQVNANFAQLQSWLEQKVGPVGSNNVSVGGTATVTGNTTLGANLTVTGPDVSFANLTGRGNGGRAIVHDTSDTLVFNYGTDFSGGTRVDGSLNVGNALSVGGALNVGGALSVGGGLSVSGALSIGLVRQVCSNIASGAECTCPAGTRLLGGGAYCDGDNWHVNSSWASSATAWQAWCENGVGANQNVTVTILCARM